MARPTRSPERSGPHDADDVHAELSDAPGVVDFGAVRVPVPDRGTITVEPGENGRMQAVHISLPEGRLSVSALAAPTSSRLWPDLAKEIDASLREGGARVRSFQGEWGRELHATTGAATSVFVGVDGTRWMLYGVATGPTRDAAPLLEELRRTVRGAIVVRGRSPYPVRTVLPLQPPGHLVDDASDPAVTPTPTVVVRAVARGGAPAVPAPAPARRAHPTAGPTRPLDPVRDSEDGPTDVWPDGLLPSSRGHGPTRPATPPSMPEVPRRGRHAAAEGRNGEGPGGWPGTPAPRQGPGEPRAGRHRRRE
jgi:Protein of unknown function (DUF3710)